MQNSKTTSENSRCKHNPVRYNDPFPSALRILCNSSKDVQDLASFLGCSTQAITQYKLGQALPKIENLIKIAHFYDCSLDFLIGLSDVRSPKAELQAICQYTGLSEKAVELLHYLSSSDLYDEKRTVDFLNKILSDPRYDPPVKADDQLETIVVDDPDQDSEETGNQQIAVDPDLKVIDTLFMYLDQYITSGKVEREIREDSSEFETRTVKIRSSDNLTEIIDIPRLYRSYKMDEIRIILDHYLKDEQEER